MLSDLLFVIRSHIELLEVDMRVVQPDQDLTRLREIIAELRALPDFDCILLDCPPSMGLMTKAAMAAADELLVPLQQGFMMLPALSCLLSQMQQVIASGVNPGLHVGGFVINRYNDDAGQLKEIAHELHAIAQPYMSGNVAYPIAIPESVSLAEAPGHGLTILEYDHDGIAANSFRGIASTITDCQ